MRLLLSAVVGAALLPAWAHGLDTLLVVPQVNPVIVKVGEPFSARIAVDRPDTNWVLFGPPAPSETGPLDIRRSEGFAESDSSIWEFECALFETGELFFPPIPFMYTNQVETLLVMTEPYRVSVETSLPEDSTQWALRDIQGPIVPDKQVRWGRVALAFGLLAALTAAVLLWRRRSAVEPPAPHVPREPAHVEALRALRDLEQAALPARGMFKEHFVSLSHILRVYLQRRFDIPAVESTTDEIAGHFKRRPVVEESKQSRLLDLFQEADLVKFAKFLPSQEQSEAAAAAGKRWVEETAQSESEAKSEIREEHDEI